MSLKRKIFNNGLASTLQKVVRVLQQLMLVPFFISSWGAEYYGEWITLTIIPSVLALSDFGFGTAASNTFVLRYAAGDKQGAKNIAKSGIYIITLVIFFALIVSGVTLYILNHFEVFEKSLIDKNDLITALSFMMIARLLNFYYQFFSGFFRASGRAALSINLITLFNLSNLIFSFLVLILGGGVVEFATVNLILAMIFNPFFSWKSYRIIDFKETSKASLFKSDVKYIATKGLGYLLSPAWQAIYFQGTTFAVRLTLGATGVTIYNTIRTVTRSLNQLFTIVNSSVFPEIQYEKGKGNMNNVRKIFMASVSTVFVVAFFGCIFLIFFGEYFYELWTKNLLEVPPGMWNIFILGVMFNAIWFSSGVVFNAFNQPYKYALAGLICSIISVISSYFLCLKLGLVGAAIGSIVLDILMVFYVLPTSCNLVGQSLSRLVTHSYKNFRLILSKKNI